MSKQHRVELARTLCASGKPVNKSQLAKLLGIARSSLYTHPQRPRLDKALALRIESLQELDDTLGHRKLAVLLKTGKNWVKRVMRKYGLAARLASMAIRRLRRLRQRELGNAAVVLYMAGCYGVFSLEELLAVLGSASRESLLPALTKLSAPDSPT